VHDKDCTDNKSGACDKLIYKDDEKITPAIKISLNDKGDDLLKEATENNIGNKLVMIAGNKNNIVGYPSTIQSQFGGNFIAASPSNKKANESISAIVSNNRLCGVVDNSSI
jgi:preprotein translocase subunit SecD